MRTDEEKLNEATAMLDRAIELAAATQRQITRIMEDLELKNELLVDLIDEYDRLTSKWADEEGR